jgi:hypothetical protein
MADEQTTQATQEQGGAQTAGGDPTTSTQSFAQNILGDVNPDGIVRKTGAQGAAKTFTQDEVNDLIKARVQRERKGLPGKEELEAFHKWQDDQKSAEQKSAEAIKVQSDRADAAEKKVAALEAKLLATSKGVKPDAADDVVALASLKVSDDMPLEKAIDEVLKKYPQFAGGSAPTTGVSGGNGSAAISGVEAAFRAKNPGIKF